MTLRERFNKKWTPEPNTGCWLWMAGVDKNGYGKISAKRGRKQAHFRAHRASWELCFGSPPEGMLVCHRCDTAGCVNPAHLFLGTNADNMRDKVSKGRQVRGDAHWTRQKPELVVCGERWRLAHHNVASGQRNGKYTKPESTPRGSKHGNAKLTERSVIEIRARYARGAVTQETLAQEFGVSQVQIGRVLRRIVWSHLSQPQEAMT